jgi:hypothetical protein
VVTAVVEAARLAVLDTPKAASAGRGTAGQAKAAQAEAAQAEAALEAALAMHCLPTRALVMLIFQPGMASGLRCTSRRSYFKKRGRRPRGSALRGKAGDYRPTEHKPARWRPSKSFLFSAS